jgi:hypothetical protein
MIAEKKNDYPCSLKLLFHSTFSFCTVSAKNSNYITNGSRHNAPTVLKIGVQNKVKQFKWNKV